METSSRWQKLLPPVVSLAQKAGEAVMKIYSEAEVATTRKEDGSPVTRADIASHELIMDQLLRLTPELPILSEESKTAPYEVRQSWRVFWLVDPLDGTKEFISRNGEFTVNIALIEDGRPVLGVVHAPAMNATYFAAQGLGAFKKSPQNETTAIAVRKCQRAQQFKVVASRSHADERLQRFLDKISSVDCISMGSSLKLCLVAEGEAHLYPRLGPTMEWDTAAAQCIVEVAGGTVVDARGQALVYNKPNLLNPNFIVSGDPSFPWQSYMV